MGRIKQPIGDRWTIALGIIGIVVLAGAYEIVSYRQHTANPKDTTIPNLSQLLEGFRQICEPKTNDLRPESDDMSSWGRIASCWLYKDAFATYGRLVKGLVWGSIISVIIGLLMGCFEGIGSFLLPPLAFLAKVPGTAMLAVFFVLVGTGENMFIGMIGFGLLPTLTQAVYASARYDVHDEEINKAYTLGASNCEVIWNVVLKQIMPKVLESIRLQIGPSVVYLIAAEMLVGQVGMGYQIRLQQRLLNMSVVYDYLLILGVSGLLMDQGMLLLRRWLCPWYSRYK